MQRGDRLDKYTLDAVIARGGMGEVWRAHQDNVERPVAIKILRADVQTDRARALFDREAKNLARLNSPYTVRLIDAGVNEAGSPYIVTELLEGEDLWTRILRAGPLPWREVIAIADQVLRALAEAHAINLIHRDIKPANIFLQTVPGDSVAVKVLDFGISKLIDPDVDEDTTLLPGMKGSPRYMAPEQIEGNRASLAIDIYAMGALLYCMLAGEPPFKGELIVVLRSQLNKAPKPLLERGIDVPPALDALVMRCLHKDPSIRPASAHAVRALLERCDISPARRADEVRKLPPPPSERAPSPRSDSQPGDRAHQTPRARAASTARHASDDESWTAPPTPRAPANGGDHLVRNAALGLAVLLLVLIGWRTVRVLTATPETPVPSERRGLTKYAKPIGNGPHTPVTEAPAPSSAAVRDAMVRVVVNQPARFVDGETAELRCDAAPACMVPVDRPLRIEADGFADEAVSPSELAARSGAVLRVTLSRR